LKGRAIAQAVSCRLPTVAARFQSQVTSYGTCGGQSGTGAGFLQVLQFPQPVLIPPNSTYSRAGTIGQSMAYVQCGPLMNKPPPPPPVRIKKKYIALKARITAS
jgi:hypothetical protein